MSHAALADFRFDVEVADNGYRWFYLDTTSSDGTWGLCAIGFIGSVFSVRYAKARAGHARVSPYDFCATHLVVYGPRNRWVLNEVRSTDVLIQPRVFRVGATTWQLDGDTLRLTFDEPVLRRPRRLTGAVEVTLRGPSANEIVLDTEARHHWRPLGPLSTADVHISSDDLSFSGPAYFDTNRGEVPLEESFRSWTWGRFSGVRDGFITYDTQELGALGVTRRSFRVSPQATFETDGLPYSVPLGKTRWGLSETARSSSPGGAKRLKRWEDTPFYARSTLRNEIMGRSYDGVHETLSLERFSKPWVQGLLPFRIAKP